MRKHILLFAPLLLGACISWTPRSARTSSSAVALPDMPMQKWGIESCGAGALSTVLQHHGDPTSMAEWDATLPRTRGGVMTIDMLLAARKKGFDARLVTGTPELVTAELREGRPVILMLQVIDYPGRGYDFFHYIVADGIDPERRLIRTQFGDGKARWVTFDRIEKSWAGGANAAIVIRPGDPAVNPVSEPLRAAVALEEQGKLAEAAAAYREILAANDRSAIAWTNLGNVESRRGNRAAAEEAFRKALSIDAESADALNNLAWLLYESKRFDEAEPLARRAAASTAPDAWMRLDTLARIQLERGACAEALQTWARAVESIPASRSIERDEMKEEIANTRCPT